MPEERSLSLVNSVADTDKIRVVTEDGLSHSIEVNKLKNSLLVDDLPDRVSELETKANTNETDHIDMVSRLDELELIVGEETVSGETVTNSGLFEKISKVRSDLATLHLEEVDRIDGELSGIRTDLTLINGTNGELTILAERQNDLESVVNAGFKVIGKTPDSASTAGQPGEVCWDTSYFYVCVGINTWKRIPLESW